MSRRLHFTILSVLLLWISAGSRTIATGNAAEAGPAKTDLKMLVSHQHFAKLAKLAAGDLILHYWIRTPSGHEIMPTWNGFPSRVDRQGVLWERAMLFLALENDYRATGDPRVLPILRAEDHRLKKLYSLPQLQACGVGSLSPAVDDSGWDAMLFLSLYRYLGDRGMLRAAMGLVTHAYHRWLDSKFGGGLWYNDQRKIKSLYQVGIVLDSLQIYEITRRRAFYKWAQACYNWMQSRLLRKDGVYWCDYGANGPIGKSRPNDINEGGSVSFLGGTMAMAVIDVKLYHITRNPIYLERALRTVAAVDKVFNRNGIYVDDRDAWCNATFMGQWAADVLTLPGVAPPSRAILFRTALSVYKNARTKDGYYGGSWAGPAQGPGSRWWPGSSPQQIMTSSDSANVIMAAAILEQALSPTKFSRHR